jgi:peptidyl-tRNA hydrolase
VTDDPLRMFLVLQRGAVTSLARAGELAGAAAVACLRRFSGDPRYAEALATWAPRPGKICLRARSAAQWHAVLAEPHALAGAPEAEAVAALPPRRRSERGPVLERLQAMSTALDAAPGRADRADDRRAVTYLLDPSVAMSSGKTVAQVAHAAVEAAARADTGAWVAAGCPGRLLAPDAAAFAAATRCGVRIVARVVDAGLTEVEPGTVTVVALAPGPAAALPAELVARSGDAPPAAG